LGPGPHRKSALIDAGIDHDPTIIKSNLLEVSLDDVGKNDVRVIFPIARGEGSRIAKSV
jgi:hypothetical protein